jgi:hypothetical protein
MVTALTVGVQDVVNPLQRQALSRRRTAAQLDNVRHRLDGHESRRGGGRVGVLGDPQLAALLVLELDFEDAVGLA